jgi:predicted metal-binding membrane protein
MQNLNYFFGTAFGVYLIAVVYHGNGEKLIALLAGQKAFVKWAAALAILMFIEKQTKSPIAGGFVYAAIVAMLLSAAENQSLAAAGNQIQSIFGSKS